MFIHRRAIDAVGLLDAAYFFSIEDVDYCRRVRDAGLEVVFLVRASAIASAGVRARRSTGRWRRTTGDVAVLPQAPAGNRLLDAVTFAGSAADSASMWRRTRCDRERTAPSGKENLRAP
jgi:hypothetical protein